MTRKSAGQCLNADLPEKPEYYRIFSCNAVFDSGRDKKGVACATPFSANNLRVNSDANCCRAHTRHCSC